MADPEQDEKTAADLADGLIVNDHGGGAYSLDDGAHARRLPVGAHSNAPLYLAAFFLGSAFSRFAISMAERAASAPRLPALVPARSTACSMLSAVTTP